MRLRLHAFEPASRANGPALRAVIWFQGCTLACPGCFNPGTHDPTGGYEADTTELAAQVLALRPTIEGLSVSGGEPFQQPEALLDLLQRLDGSGLSRLVFTGYSLEELRPHDGDTIRRRVSAEILAHIDVLIAGRYVQSQHVGQGLLGSANQKVHLLTDRYSPHDITRVPWREVILHADGTITLSGIQPLGSSAR